MRSALLTTRPARPAQVGAIALSMLVFVALGFMISRSQAANITVNVSTDAQFDSALSSATGGETIVVASGTYSLKILPKQYASLVTITGADRNATVVNGIRTNWGTPYASNITVSNLTIKGGAGFDAVRINQGSHHISFNAVTIKGGDRCFVINSYPYDQSAGTIWAHDVSISNSDISGSPGDLFQIAGAKNFTVTGNRLHDNAVPAGSTDHVDGIQLIGSENVRILGNEITNPNLPAVSGSYPHQGIIAGRADPYSAALYVKGTYIANNIIHRWNGSGMIFAGTQDSYVVNNTVADSTNSGGSFYTAVKDSTHGGTNADWYNTNLNVWNNIFQKTNITRSGQASTLYPAYQGYNLITGDSASNVTVGTGNLVGSAQFVTNAPTSADFYALTAASPAVNSGTVFGSAPNNTPATDYAGRTRDVQPDRGAREYGAAASTPSPTPTPGALPEDLNADGHVTILDLSILLSHWSQTGTAIAGDINADGTVNVFDLSSLLSKWGV